MSATAKKYLPLGIIIIVALALYLFRLGGFPLYDYDEATYGGIALATLQNHAFFTLHSLTGPWFEKPPLYIWGIMASIKLFGISEWSIRLPSALCGVSAVALIYLLVMEMADDVTTATLASTALLVMPLFYFEGRQSRMDIPVIAAILFTLLAFIKGRKDRRWFLLMGVGLATAVMIKSVIGLLVGVPIILFALFFKEWKWIKNRYFWAGSGIGLLLLLPWHLYELSHFGNGFWSIYFTQQVFSRAVAGFGGGITTITYLELLWYQFVPWTQVAILLLPLLYFMKRSDARTKIAALGLGTALVYFALFAAARTKLGEYLLPIYPFVALYVTAGLSSLREKTSSMPRWIWAIGIFVIFSTGLFYTLRVQFIDFNKWYPAVYAERDIGNLIAASPTTTAIYSYNIQNYPTLLFYGEKAIVPLQSTTPPQSGSFMLIAQKRSIPVLSQIPRYAQASVAYDSDAYILIFVDSSTSPLR